MWTDFVDNVFVVNLTSRPHRLEQTKRELDCFAVDFTRWEATQHKDGKKGLRESMRLLFEHCIKSGYERVCVFEDDIKIVQYQFNVYIEECVDQLPTDFDLFYFGGNIFKPPTSYSRSLILTPAIYSTHAVVYSKKSIVKILKELNKKEDIPYDTLLVRTIQKNNKSYCAHPLLISQHPGYSDIMNRVVDYEKYIEKRYAEKTAHL